jgi:hypothetical protein
LGKSLGIEISVKALDKKVTVDLIGQEKTKEEGGNEQP